MINATPNKKFPSRAHTDKAIVKQSPVDKMASTPYFTTSYSRFVPLTT